MSEWQIVGEDIVQLEPGQQIVGTYVDRRTTFGENELPNPVHVLKTEEGSEVGIWASWDLDRKLDGLGGREVRITFKGTRLTGNTNDDGSDQTVKDYRVEVKGAA